MPDKKLTDEWLKEIREKISCPQFGNEHYGEWGILTLNQRRTIKRLLDFIEAQEKYINRLQAENKNLQERNVILRGLVDTQKAENEKLKKSNEMFTDIGKLYSEIKAEAYAEAHKEFAERLKQVFWSKAECDFLIRGIVDNLLKEMVGEDNG